MVGEPVYSSLRCNSCNNKNSSATLSNEKNSSATLIAVATQSQKRKAEKAHPMELQPEQQLEATPNSKLHMPKPTLFSSFKNLMKEVPLVSQLLDGGVQQRKDEAMIEVTKDEAMIEDTKDEASEADTKDEATKEDTKDKAMEVSPEESTKLRLECMKEKFYEM